ncbi:60S ribosomal protein L31 [Astathelohania contejeani]|uniref:60S ribosomal protein L31 n=1 Tax=Astathelohania contejeani TaxID=164912 RepID=A0ABQ7HZ20_9MICR|nr:60S ribosomal protein L31 [Thelohania contejeani]
MDSVLQASKVFEMTISPDKLVKNISWVRKAKCIGRRIKRHIKSQFKSDDDVIISPELNKKLWGRGITKVPKKIRVRVERVPSPKNPEKNVFMVSEIIVGSFKGLLTTAIKE